jgi:hypothetical protein
MAVTTVRFGPAPARKLHALAGFGAQLNTNLFTRAGEPRDLAPGQLAALQAAIDNLKLGHSRIFIRRGMRPDTPQGKLAPEFVALMKTIKVAHGAGPAVNVNLTWWGQGPYANERKLAELDWPNRNIRTWPQKNRRKWPPQLVDPARSDALTAPRVMMQRFAQIVEEARGNGFSCVTHATIQNEVNGAGTDIAKQNDPGLSMRLYELLYRHLDTALKAIADPVDPTRRLRESIQIVGGDLLEREDSPEDNQDAWLTYMHANMEVPRDGFGRVLDGYSIHVYWEPGDGPEGFPQKLETRLANLQQTMRDLRSDLPVYVTEYGVRKLQANPRPGKLDGVPIEKSPEVAFQHAWFNALAPQYGCVGLVKWALYRTDLSDGWGGWGMIDAPQAKFERSPVYRVTRLFNHLIGTGWTAGGLGRDDRAGVLSSRFAAPNGSAESVVVLNKGAQRQDVRVQGLKPKQRYFGANWNRDGKGTIQTLSPVTADAGGFVTVSVPSRGLVALSTRQLAL